MAENEKNRDTEERSLVRGKREKQNGIRKKQKNEWEEEEKKR